MNLYKKMYVVSEDEYRRLTECEQPLTTTTTPLLVKSNHLDTEHIPQQQQDEIVVFKKKHKCGHCEREYSDKHDLRRHKKKLHAANKDLDSSLVNIKTQVEEEEKDSSSDTVKQKVKLPKQQYYRKDPFRENITKWRTMF